MSSTIEKRQTKEKELMIEALKKTPIVEIACKKAGIGRATYYRWRIEDEGFAKKADEALLEGSQFINDMAESQLLTAIRDNNLSAIIFWLRNHHAIYANKLELTGELKHEYKLTSEEEALIAKALAMVTQKGGEGL